MARRTHACVFPYVPNFIPGELLYAWISRLHVLNGLPNPRSTLKALFGSHTSTLSGDLPCGLRYFCRQTKEWGPFLGTPDVACQATLYPYFSRFMSRQRRGLLLNSMCSVNGNGLKAGVGLLANGFGATVLLKSCIKCDAACEEEFGCKTWFRVHQLPGVSICPAHGCSLQFHVVQSGQANRHTLHVSHSGTAKNASAVFGLCAERFALLSEQALHCSAKPLSDEERTGRYYAGIARLGLGTGNKIHWEVLAQLVGDHYDWFSGMYCQERLLSSPSQPLRWLRDLCQRPKRNMHPICHILLAGYLYGDLGSFFTATENRSIEDKSLRRVYSMSPKLASRNDGDLERLLHDQSLSCREVARQTGRSVNGIVTKRRALKLAVGLRPKILMSEQENEIVKLARDGCRAAGISEEVNLSLSTVYRALAANNERIQPDRRAEQRRREEWLDLMKSHPFAGTTSLRQQLPSVYSWLYRHDRKWLIEHCPIRSKPKALTNARVDWSVRDTYFASLIRDVAGVERGSRRKRVSATFLLRSTSHETMIRRNYAKFPQVKKALDYYAESDASFRARRWKSAQRGLVQEGITEPPEWMVNRKSGIRMRKTLIGGDIRMI
ncbi:Helix-turn-helix domain of resolvase [Collimonas sp. OK307]|uniref:TnsD family Tn7-like transposition protein n=1 Tax=Collimonas sp. OK307 TaxID=1801620 RepID=UPI0008DFE3D9|nr:TnsD family Tn7-like transposition protein [Collimonas sp. OK307]SFI37410.1 Helix-turn-helix domain of resolvase [Collimonas sp. OK307]